MQEDRLRTVIIEDSPPSREVLEYFLKESCADTVQLSGDAESVESGITLIRAVRPALVFLDIELIGGNGFDMLRAFGKEERNFDTIITTHLGDFKLDAIKERVVDYLVKPFGPDDVVEAVGRVLENRRIQSEWLRQQKNEMLLEYEENHGTKDPFFPVESSNGNFYLCRHSSIIYVESDGRQSMVFTTSHGGVHARGNVSAFEKAFSNDKRFERVSREAIVNCDHVKALHRADEKTPHPYLSMTNDLKVKVPESGFLKIKEMLRGKFR